MNNDMVPVIRGTKLISGIETYVGVIALSALDSSVIDIPIYDAKKDTGYQRNPQDARVRNLARDILSMKVDLPTAILISVRKPVPDKFLLQSDEGIYLDIQALKAEGLKMNIVDGQHRIRALQRAAEVAQEQGSDISLNNFKLPFVCMINADEDEEMKQFYVVNKNAKSVTTDLALSILNRQDGISEDLPHIKATDRWKLRATQIAGKLCKDKGFWQGRIRLANMEKGDTTIPMAAFVKSMEIPFRRSATFEALSLELQCRILNSFWDAIVELIPEAFTDDGQKEYSIQKGVGVGVLNALIPISIACAQAKRQEFFRAKIYESILEDPIKGITGTNGEGDEVAGSDDFWKTGSAGAIGALSNEGGKAMLIRRLEELCPALSDDLS